MNALLLIIVIISVSIEGVIGFSSGGQGDVIAVGWSIRVDFDSSETNWFWYSVNVTEASGSVSIYVLPTSEVDNCLSTWTGCEAYLDLCENGITSVSKYRENFVFEYDLNTFLIVNHNLFYSVSVDWEMEGGMDTNILIEGILITMGLILFCCGCCVISVIVMISLYCCNRTNRMGKKVKRMEANLDSLNTELELKETIISPDV